MPVRVRRLLEPPSILASPKSSTFTRGERPVLRVPSSMTFSGFMSRWTMPCAWAASRASRMDSPIPTTCRVVSPPWRSSLYSVRPWTSSMTMYRVPSDSVPKSWRVTTAGWSRWAMVRASRRKRFLASSPLNAPPGRITLMATGRSTIGWTER